MIPNIFAFTGIATLALYWWGLYEHFPSDQVAGLDVKVALFSLVGGILPALLWLWFWLKEDAKNPEPGSIILLAFLGGMIAVPFTIPFEQAALTIVYKIEAAFSLVGNESAEVIIDSSIIVLWAFIEEFVKYIAIYLVALKSKFFDEPVDALIYLITGALGFAALENSLYLMHSVVDNGILAGAINTHMRFLGATLLHVVSSSAIGLAIAFSFYKKKRRGPYLVWGIVAATILHAVFNLFIIETQNVLETLIVFSYYWIIVIILIFLFERIKLLKRTAVSSVNIIRLK